MVGIEQAVVNGGRLQMVGCPHRREKRDQNCEPGNEQHHNYVARVMMEAAWSVIVFAVNSVLLPSGASAIGHGIIY